MGKSTRLERGEVPIATLFKIQGKDFAEFIGWYQ